MTADKLAPLLLITLLVSACINLGPAGPAIPATPFPPDGCGAAQIEDARILTLPPTRAQDAGEGSLAQRHELERSLVRAGTWNATDTGWSSLAVSLQSAGAQSLSLQLREVELPARSEIWICSPDRRQRHGPYREATGGVLWAPAIAGERLYVQVWTPSAGRGQLRAQLAAVDAGFN